MVSFCETYGQNVWVKYDVIWIEPDFVDENVERPLTDFDLPVLVRCLALFIEGHDDDGGAVPLDDGGLCDEVLFAFLQRDRVDDALPLATFQAGLDHLEVGRILRNKNN